MKKNRKRSRDDAMLMTLCARCVSQYYNSPEHIVCRVNPNQQYKETCGWCGCKQGWDYRIITKKGGKIK